MKNVITTTFSVSMLPASEEANLRIREVDEETFNRELGDDFESYVGHEATAKLLSAKFGKEIPFNRANVTLTPDIKLFVAVPQFRVDVAREFTEDEIKKSKFRYFIIEMVPQRSVSAKWLRRSVFKHDIIELIQEEEEGISEYRRLLDEIDDPEIKRKIEEIIRDEEKHRKILEDIVDNLS
jgi:hypothetical protein